MSWEKDYKAYEALESGRVNFEWMWQRVADCVIPRRGDFTVTRFQGQRRDYNVYDSTAQWALEQLAAALHTLLTSQALPWFYLKVRDDDLNNRQDVQLWLQDTYRRINAVFNDPQTRFQSQIHEYYTDLGAFGTAVMDVQYDKGVKFTTRFLGECYIAQTYYGIVDTLFRCFSLPLHRAIEIFGQDALPSKMLKEQDMFRHFKFLHAVVPDGKGKWDSRYYAYDYKHLVKEGKFSSFPYIVARWSKSSTEDYGRSPAIRALSDILMVNEQKRTLLRAQHKAVDPPLLAPDDGFMQPINLTPGAVNYYDTSTPGEIKYLESKSRMDAGEGAMKESQEAIIRAFYVDMLQLPGGLMPGAQNQNTYMTATEATIRRENAMRVLGPIVSRLQTELLNPLITRVYEILRKQRSLAPAPAAIEGQGIDIEYISPLAIAQEGAEVDNWTRFWAQIQPVAALDPTALDAIKFEALPPWLASRYHLSPNLIRSPEEIAQMQAQRAAQQAAEQQQIQENTNLISAKSNTENAKAMTALAGAGKAQ